jgi:hypothetical protein
MLYPMKFIFAILIGIPSLLDYLYARGNLTCALWPNTVGCQ